MDNQKELIIKYSVISIICIIGLLFSIICMKLGLSVGKEIGELIYNLKH